MDLNWDVDLNELKKSLTNDFKLFDDQFYSWNINYLKIQSKRYHYELSLVKKYYTSGKILEIGSLPYHMTFFLKAIGADVTGTDIDPDRARKFIEKNQLHIKKCDIERDALPFEDNSFELILFNEVFEHLRIDPIFTLKELNRVLKPGGHLIFSTPNKYKFLAVLHYLVGQSYIKPYQQFKKIEELGHMGHIREYSKGELKAFLDGTGFTIKKTMYKNYKIKWGKFFIYLPQHIIPFFRSYIVNICTK